MNVYELAKKYYPIQWDKSRIAALVTAGRLSSAEAEEIVGAAEQQNNPQAE